MPQLPVGIKPQFKAYASSSEAVQAPGAGCPACWCWDARISRSCAHSPPPGTGLGRAQPPRRPGPLAPRPCPSVTHRDPRGRPRRSPGDDGAGLAVKQRLGQQRSRQVLVDDRFNPAQHLRIVSHGGHTAAAADRARPGRASSRSSPRSALRPGHVLPAARRCRCCRRCTTCVARIQGRTSPYGGASSLSVLSCIPDGGSGTLAREEGPFGSGRRSPAVLCWK
jgi:hypothetical protein